MEREKNLFEELKNKLVIVSLRDGSYAKGELVGFDSAFIKIQSLKIIKLISKIEIATIREWAKNRIVTFDKEPK